MSDDVGPGEAGGTGAAGPGVDRLVGRVAVATIATGGGVGATVAALTGRLAAPTLVVAGSATVAAAAVATALTWVVTAELDRLARVVASPAAAPGPGGDDEVDREEFGGADPGSGDRRPGDREDGGEPDAGVAVGDVPGRGRDDVIGRLAGAVARTRAALADERSARQSAESELRAVRSATVDHCGVLDRWADGQLGHRMRTDAPDPMAEIAGEFNVVAAEFERTVSELQGFADELSDRADEVAAGVVEARDGGYRVAETVRSIATGTRRQQEQLDAALANVERLNERVESITDASGDVSELADRTASAGREGRAAARTAIEGMARIERESGETATAIRRLQREVSQVDDLVDAISDIAERTNMLALTADLEATRASTDGTDGSGAGTDAGGFTAVAAEIRELAERSREAATEAEELLSDIEARTGRAVEEVDETTERVAEHADSVANAAAALDEIAALAGETSDGVREISEATEAVAAVSADVLGAVEAATASSEAATTAARQTARAVESRTNALEAAVESADDLADRAAYLDGTLRAFDARPAVLFVDDTSARPPGAGTDAGAHAHARSGTARGPQRTGDAGPSGARAGAGEARGESDGGSTLSSPTTDGGDGGDGALADHEVRYRIPGPGPGPAPGPDPARGPDDRSGGSGATMPTEHVDRPWRADPEGRLDTGHGLDVTGVGGADVDDGETPD